MAVSSPPIVRRNTVGRWVVPAALYALLVAVIVFVVVAADWSAIRENFFDLDVVSESIPAIIIVATKNTIIYTLIAFTGGLLLGLVLALMKSSPVAPYRWIATAYIEFFRGLPALLVIFAFAFAVPIAFGWRPPGGSVGAGLLALIVVGAAYIAETIRAGIEAVPKGQIEASRSLGVRSGWTTAQIVLPQALRIMIPPLTNELVVTIKDTSLLFIAGMAIGQRELTTFARDGMTTYANATTLIAASVMYLVITLPLTRLVARLEKRAKRSLR